MLDDALLPPQFMLRSILFNESWQKLQGNILTPL
jgi:hypothetical protein